MSPRFLGSAVLLSWRNLTENRLRLLSSVAGAAFAVTLMFVESGFRDALLDSMTAVIRQLDGELVIISRRLYTLGIPMPFPSRRLDLPRGFDDVEKASPFYVETRRSRWRGPYIRPHTLDPRRAGRLPGDEDPSLPDSVKISPPPHRIRVIAYRPEDDLLNIPAVREAVPKWNAPQVALVDLRSKAKIYGVIPRNQDAELANRRIRVVGDFELGTDFQNDGTLLMTEENFLDYFPERRGPTASDRKIDVGVIRVSPGADIPRLRESIARILPEDVLVMTREEFVDKEKRFWGRVAPVGIVFNIGVVMGFVVGLAICYQVLFSDVADREAEFATLKAVGHRNRWLSLVVVLQGVFLAFLGFVVGVAVSQGIFIPLIEKATGLPLEFKPMGALSILGLTVLMCTLSGLLAARRVQYADPAQLFR
ncbi:MAG: FtsX-like permease family protein [Isosphaeraceae bacterium]